MTQKKRLCRDDLHVYKLHWWRIKSKWNNSFQVRSDKLQALKHWFVKKKERKEIIYYSAASLFLWVHWDHFKHTYLQNVTSSAPNTPSLASLVAQQTAFFLSLVIEVHIWKPAHRNTAERQHNSLNRLTASPLRTRSHVHTHTCHLGRKCRPALFHCNMSLSETKD